MTGQTALPITWTYSPIIEPLSVAYSPNGQLVAVGGYGGIQLLNASNGKLITCLPTQATVVNSVAFSKDGKTLADGGAGPDTTGGIVGILETWNIATGAQILSLPTAGAYGVWSVAFSPDGTKLADSGQTSIPTSVNPLNNATLEVWNLSSGKLIKDLPTGADNGIFSVAFSPDGTLLADGGSASNFEGVLEVWSVSSWTLRLNPTIEAEAAEAIAFSPDGSLLADGGYSGFGGSLQLWSTSTGNLATSYLTNITTPNSLAFSSDGSMLTCGGSGNSEQDNGVGGVELWSVGKGTLTTSFPTIATGGIQCVAFSPNGASVVDGGYARFGISAGASVFESWSTSTFASNITLSVDSMDGLNALAFSPDATRIVGTGYMTNPVTGLSAGTVGVWNASSGALLDSLTSAANVAINSTALSPDNQTLAEGGQAVNSSGLGIGILELWNYVSGKQLRALPTAADVSVVGVAVSPDGTTLADGGRSTTSGVLELWNISTGNLTAALPTGANQGVYSVAFSLDGSMMASGGMSYSQLTGNYSGVLELWQIDGAFSNLKVSVLTGLSSVYEVALSPDGSMLADYGEVFVSDSGANLDNVVELWSTATGRLLATLVPVTAGASASGISFSPDGGVLLVGTAFTGIQAYSLSTYKLVGSFDNPSIVDTIAAPTTGPLLAYSLFKGATIPTGFVISQNPYYSPAAVSSVSLNPTSVQGGMTPKGTVTLTSVAPSGGIIIPLASSSAVASVPANVAVGEGQSYATFSIATVGVNTSTTATITAGTGTSVQSAVLTVTPPGLKSLSISPTSVGGGTTATGTVTLTAPAGPSGVSITLSTNNAAASVKSTVSIAAQATSGTFTITTSAVSTATTAKLTASFNGQSVSGSVTVTPAVLALVSLSPSALVGGTSSTGTVSLSGNVASKPVVISLSSNSSNGVVPSSVTVTSGHDSATFTVKTLAVSSSKTVTITAKSGMISKTAALTLSPAAITSLTLSPTTVAGGSSSLGTITLTGIAPSGGATVKLSSTLGAATVPGSVTVAAGKSSATFTVKTSGVATQSVATIAASLGAFSKQATLTVSAPTLLSVSLSPATVAGGKSSTGTVSISSVAPSAGLKITLSSSSGVATTPTTVTIPSGKTSVTFTVKTTKVSSATTAKITATLGETSKVAALTIS